MADEGHIEQVTQNEKRAPRPASSGQGGTTRGAEQETQNEKKAASTREGDDGASTPDARGT